MILNPELSQLRTDKMYYRARKIKKRQPKLHNLSSAPAEKNMDHWQQFIPISIINIRFRKRSLKHKS
jgi:hypothetical protein